MPGVIASRSDTAVFWLRRCSFAVITVTESPTRDVSCAMRLAVTMTSSTPSSASAAIAAQRRMQQQGNGQGEQGETRPGGGARDE